MNQQLYKKIGQVLSSPLMICLGFLTINLIFNYNIFWSELWYDRSKIGAVWGEVQMYEWLTEKFYRQLIAGHNPFGLTQGILYPFSISLGLTDAANGLFFVILRPFFSTHQAMSLIVTFGQLAACFGMYFLLSQLRVRKMLSFIFAAAYSYMTFLAPRLGHLNYWCLYLFPWFYYFLLLLTRSKSKWQSLAASVGTAAFFTLTLWLNFYYFIMLLTSLFFLACYLLIRERKFCRKILRLRWLYLLFSSLLANLLLVPWYSALLQLIRFDEIPKTQGFAGAIMFSADLFGFLIPGLYGYYMHSVGTFIAGHLAFVYGLFENFTYPGMLILFSLTLFIVLRKRIPKTRRRLIYPVVMIAFSFWLLTLGPFLHVFGRWGMTVDDGIRIVVPMPYLLFHAVPLLNNIRVPGRLVVILIFFAYTAGALAVNAWLTGKSKKVYYIAGIILFAIFWIDQRYIDTYEPPSQIYPYRIFEYIQKDPLAASVLEIPFTVRDGFTYFGDNNKIDMCVGEMYHGKPVLGGYTGRIAEYKNIYYRNNPLFGYLGRNIDAEAAHNPMVDQNTLPRWATLDKTAALNTIDFLDIKYVITQDDKPYFDRIRSDLMSLQYRVSMKDVGFSLWEKPVDQKEFTGVTFGQPNDDMYLGMGWHPPESNGRWAKPKSSIMLKVAAPRKMMLSLTAKGHQNQQVLSVYLNEHRVADLVLDNQMRTQAIPIETGLKKGINIFHFVNASGLNSFYHSVRLIEPK